MSRTELADAHGALTEPTTLRIQRRLPGSIERVWDHLTRSELRRQWLAAGEMTLTVGAPFELVWRNDDLSDEPGRRPAEFAAEMRMSSRITELDPPRRLGFTWRGSGDVTFELEPQGADVLLTVTHRRLPDRPTLVQVAAGWHTHLDLLVARAAGAAPQPFWDEFRRLRGDYEQRLPA